MILQLNGRYPSAYRIERVAGLLKDGEIIGLPTDTTYALACLPDNRTAVNQLLALRRLKQDKRLSLVFRDLKHVSEYALVDDTAFRLLRRYLPGPYTFILEANRKLPRFIGDKRKRIGARVPKLGMIQALIEALDKPLIVTSAIDPESGLTLNDPWSLEGVFGHALAAVLDCGDVPGEFSSIIDLSSEEIEVIRVGLGDVSRFE